MQQYKERFAATGTPYDQPYAYRPESKFTYDVPSKVQLVATPEKIHRVTFDSQDCTVIDNTGATSDSYTWNIRLPRPIQKGKVILERLHLATGSAVNAGTEFAKVRLTSFQQPNSFDTTSQGRSDLLTTINIASANQSQTSNTLECETIDVVNVSTYFPLTLVIERVFTGANTVKTPIRRLVGKIGIRDESDID